MIIDGDGHVVEPVHLWTDYIPTGLHDRIHVVKDEDGWASRLVAGNHRVELNAGPAGKGRLAFGLGDAFTPGGLSSPGRRFEEAEPGGSNAEARLKVHDAEGINAAVLFPSLGLSTYVIDDPEIAGAVAEGVNRWVADYCSIAPDELYANAILPSQFPELAAAELRRAVTDHGFVAGCIWSGLFPDGRILGDESFEPIWQAAADLAVPVSIHGGAHPWPGSNSIFLSHVACHPMDAMLSFAAIYEAGVFDRHPALRVGFMESGCGWAPFWLDRMNEHVEQMGWMLRTKPTRKPSEVFLEQCFIGCEGEELMPPYVQEQLTEDSIIWASDYPHYDVEPPYLAPVLNRTDMTESQKEGLLWRAAAKYYHLDVDAITRSNTRRGAQR